MINLFDQNLVNMEIDSEPRFEDSEDEREFKEQQKDHFTVEYKLEEGQVPEKRRLIVLSGGLSQAVARILFEDSWVLSGSASATSSEEGKDKTETMFKVYSSSNVYLLVPEKKMKGANKLVAALLKVHQFADFVVLDEIYKNTYGAYNDCDFLTWKTSFLPQSDFEFLKTKEVAHFTLPAGGLGAALLVHAEIHGLSAYKVTAVTHEHYYSSEMMVTCYQHTFKHLALGDISDIAQRKQFRTILKEVNQRGNSIFS